MFSWWKICWSVVCYSVWAQKVNHRTIAVVKEWFIAPWDHINEPIQYRVSNCTSFPFIMKCHLMLSTLGKIFSRWDFEIVFLVFPENKIWHFMQIVSGNNLHELSNPVFWKKKKEKNISICGLLKKFTQWLVKVKIRYDKNCIENI